MICCQSGAVYGYRSVKPRESTFDGARRCRSLLKQGAKPVTNLGIADFFEARKLGGPLDGRKRKKIETQTHPTHYLDTQKLCPFPLLKLKSMGLL